VQPQDCDSRGAQREAITDSADDEHSVTATARLFCFQIRFAVQIRRLDKDSATTLLNRKKQLSEHQHDPIAHAS